MNLRNDLDQEIVMEEESVGQYPQDDQKENMINQYYDDDGTTTTATGGGANKLAFYYSPSGTNSLLSNSKIQYSPKIKHYFEKESDHNGVIYSLQDETTCSKGIPQTQVIVLDSERLFDGKCDLNFGTRKMQFWQGSYQGTN